LADVVVFDWCGGSAWIWRFGGLGVAVVSCFAGVAVVAGSLGVVVEAECFGVVEVLAGGTRSSVLLVSGVSGLNHKNPFGFVCWFFLRRSHVWWRCRRFCFAGGQRFWFLVVVTLRRLFWCGMVASAVLLCGVGFGELVW
jgi:hypothetical protein